MIQYNLKLTCTFLFLDFSFPFLRVEERKNRGRFEEQYAYKIIWRTFKYNKEILAVFKLGCYPDKLKGSVADPAADPQNNSSLNNSLSKSLKNEKNKDLSTILDESHLTSNSDKPHNLVKNFHNNSTGDTSLNISKTDLDKFNQTKHSKITLNQTQKLETSVSSSLKANNALLLPPKEATNEGLAKIENERKKCALGKGYSLMDWIRFSKATLDLAGNKGILRPITVEELSKHDKEDDCWMAIFGKVYNVTPYMKYHPGGVDELMKGAGKNATDLFIQVHQWVNVQSMLEKCLLGPLDSLSPPINSAKLELKPKMEVEAKKNTFEIPVLDSYQSNQSCNIVLYTKCKNLQSDCLIIDKSNDPLNSNFLILFIYIPSGIYKYCLELPAPVKENYDVKFSKEGKIEIILFKLEQIHWWQMCPKLKFSAEKIEESKIGINFRECILKSRDNLTHDTSLYKFDLPNTSRMRVPIGLHIFLRLPKNRELAKPYTVVSESLLHENDQLERQICLIIKHYSDGELTSDLNKIPIGSKVEISNYSGSFNFDVLSNCCNLYLICAGSGFTPMIRIIKRCLTMDNIEMIKIIFFNKTEQDIIYHQDLEKLGQQFSKLKICNILSDEKEHWKGKRGRINDELLGELINKSSNSPYFCICGPNKFTETAKELLFKNGHKEDEMFVF